MCKQIPLHACYKGSPLSNAPRQCLLVLHGLQHAGTCHKPKPSKKHAGIHHEATSQASCVESHLRQHPPPLPNQTAERTYIAEPRVLWCATAQHIRIHHIGTG